MTFPVDTTGPHYKRRKFLTWINRIRGLGKVKPAEGFLRPHSTGKQPSKLDGPIAGVDPKRSYGFPQNGPLMPKLNGAKHPC
jgi:hypothetical protein